MAPASKKKEVSLPQKTYKIVRKYYDKYFSKAYLHSLVFDPKQLPVVAVLLIFAEIVVNIFVIHCVKYTEIDWIAYMQEVEGFLNGTFDYSNLKGDTGPLVYPAGFVFIYSVFYFITDEGKNILLAQYIFAGLYITFLCLVFRIYCKAKKVPPYVLVLTCFTSYRIHSIFILRLFNDCVAMWLLFASINLFLDNKWNLGSLVYSFAVSVKMNILLFAPALLLAYLTSLGFMSTVKQLVLCACVQLFLGMPFLLTNFWAYLAGAFNLGRIFLYEWTVNFRFLPEEVFLSPYFHVSLLVLHIVLLMLFYKQSKTYLESWAKIKFMEKDIKKQLKNQKEKVDMSSSAQLFLLPLFTANFLGVMCSRSLHYQFYVWYFHTLPYLVWVNPHSTVVKLCILGVIESSWNTFPSTILSSLLLHVAHIGILYGLLINRDTKKGVVEIKQNKKKKAV